MKTSIKFNEVHLGFSSIGSKTIRKSVSFRFRNMVIKVSIGSGETVFVDSCPSFSY